MINVYITVIYYNLISLPLVHCLVLGISLLKVAAYLSAPVAIAKTLISVLHAYVASQNLAIIDCSEREAARRTEASKKPQ